MKEVIVQIIMEVLPKILGIVTTSLLGYLCSKYAKAFKNDTTRKVIADTVNYVEQIYTDIHGQEKLESAKQTALNLLSQKGIKISEDELTVIIESTVHEMNNKNIKKLIDDVKTGGEE